LDDFSKGGDVQSILPPTRIDLFSDTFLADTERYQPRIHYAGHERRRGGWRYEGTRSDYLLSFAASGFEWIETDADRCELDEGEPYLIRPGQWYAKGARGPSHSHWVAFAVVRDDDAAGLGSQKHQRPPTMDGPVFRPIQPDAARVWGSPIPLRLPKSLHAGLVERMLHIIGQWSSTRPGASLHAHAELALLLAHLFDGLRRMQTRRRTTSGDAAERIRRAELVAEQRLCDGYDVAAMAHEAGYGHSRFHELYAELRNRTPAVFLRELRLEAARRMLARPDLTVAQVADRLGFGDATAFGRFFRRETGRPPGAWRRDHLRRA
jgi:AraC-like DNA-binding protein